jgi:hypothetical protein
MKSGQAFLPHFPKRLPTLAMTARFGWSGYTYTTLKLPLVTSYLRKIFSRARSNWGNRNLKPRSRNRAGRHRRPVSARLGSVRIRKAPNLTTQDGAGGRQGSRSFRTQFLHELTVGHRPRAGGIWAYRKRMNAEEEMLLRDMGSGYLVYSQRTWRIIPFILRWPHQVGGGFSGGTSPRIPFGLFGTGQMRLVLEYLPLDDPTTTCDEPLMHPRTIKSDVFTSIESQRSQIACLGVTLGGKGTQRRPGSVFPAPGGPAKLIE